MYSRVKGETEKLLLAMSDRVVCFRPGYIRPVVPFTGKPWYERAYGVIVSVIPALICDADRLGRAMLRAARGEASQRVLENNAIVALGR